MISTKTFLHYAITITIILLVGGLAGWYYFLNKQKQAISTSDTGRGLDSPAPAFGGSTGSNYSNVSGTISDGTPVNQAKAPPRIWQVTKTPVAGMGFVTSTSSAATTSAAQLYFVERATGYILKADTETSLISRLTNKLFARTYEASFSSDGSVVLRSIDDRGNITSFAGDNPLQSAATASTSPTNSKELAGGPLSGKYLEPNIRMIVPMQKTRELLLLIPNAGGGSSVVLSSWNGIKQKTLFSSPLAGWKLFSLSDGRIFLSLLPSDDAAGYAFELKNGTLVPRLRNIPGLTFLPRTSSDAVLFGESSGRLSLFSSAKEGAERVYLPLQTVADKCVWAPLNAPLRRASGERLIAYCAVPQYVASSNFLMDWYRGALRTSDSWWRIDTATGEVTPLLETEETDKVFDVENPIIDSSGEQIAFMDAKDKSLWLLRITQ
ncbi:MAG: hypothetical protein Q7S01_03065 [bacterium]|nr:hypothetical protein [bacterium]